MLVPLQFATDCYKHKRQKIDIYGSKFKRPAFPGNKTQIT